MMQKNAGNPSFSYVKHCGIMHIRGEGEAFSYPLRKYSKGKSIQVRKRKDRLDMKTIYEKRASHPLSYPTIEDNIRV